jgi:hypothetical protein
MVGTSIGSATNDRGYYVIDKIPVGIYTLIKYKTAKICRFNGIPFIKTF